VRYLAALLVAGLPLGVMLAALLAVGEGWSGAAAGLLYGAVFGAAVAVPAGAVDYLRQRRLGGPSTSGSPRQRLVVRSRAPVAVLAAVLRQAVFRLHAMTVSDALPHGPLVAEIHSVRSWWAQELTVELLPADDDPDGGTDVVLRSRPQQWLMMIDFGRGRMTVNQLADAVEGCLCPPRRG
jgi:hypothetical protein